jgi:pimeloyl-ACP methyl ester carboxylesterase
MQVAKANGIDLAYVESGAGEPLILMHGGNSDRRQYDVFRPLLGEGIRAIAYDQRDSPDSPCPDASPYTVEDHARDAAEFISALGLEQAHVMGVSYGGIVALNLACLFPERMKSLIIGASTPVRDGIRAADPGSIREQGHAAIERFMLSQAMTPEAIDTDPQLVAELRAALCDRAPDSFNRRIAAMADHDVRDRLAGIRMPTLVLHGEHDPLISVETGRQMAEQIPGARFQLLEGSRHAITLQYRQRTAEFVRRFVLENA